MKRLNIKYTLLYCFLAVIGVLLILSLCVGCTIYEKTDIEIIRCPAVQDTVLLPGWEIIE